MYRSPENVMDGIRALLEANLKELDTKDMLGNKFLSGIKSAKKELKKAGKIELLVSNTAANEILAKMDVITSHPKAEVGSYNERMKPFESRRPLLKLGEVKLERINYNG